jgi:hypothetical protein
MRTLRSLALPVLVGLLCLLATASTAGNAEAQNRGHYWGYGSYNYPHYWNNGNTYSPYGAYNPYGTWNGMSGGYYGNTRPYYNWSRTYPWGWY